MVETAITQGLGHDVEQGRRGAESLGFHETTRHCESDSARLGVLTIMR